LRNGAIVNFPDGGIAQLREVGLVPVPGEGNTDEDRDEDHQDLVVLAHYGDHGLERVEVAESRVSLRGGN
jgi:hypothetical protein